MIRLGDCLDVMRDMPAVLEGRRYENPEYYTAAKSRIKKYESAKSKSRQMAS